ncbi:MAG: hypothetical protein RLZZ133_1533, partial [Pseudomonadota bacterium]
MAEQFPIDPEFQRFVGGPEGEEVPEEGLEVDVELGNAEIEELPDGSAVVTMEPEGPEENPDFYANLADDPRFDPFDLQKLAMRYIEYAEKDKQAREDRDKQYEEGIKRTGLGNDAPGGANFQGASKVVHPAMAEACIDFAARAVKELFPPDGPTRTKII